MKTIILYYSWSGKTKALAAQKAGETGADIEEITEVKRPSGFGAFFSGAPKAIGRKKTKIKPAASDLSGYEKIIIMAPVWASHPAPAFNNIVELIPSGKKIEIVMVSAGGGTKKTEQKTKELFTARGCEVVSYTDVKA
ncbi:MAG: flavodoxin [Treponema sp.]|nr:flavodoxin [Treponema sp.]